MTASGVNTLVINPMTGFAPGTYTLITNVVGLTGGTNNFQISCSSIYPVTLDPAQLPNIGIIVSPSTIPTNAPTITMTGFSSSSFALSWPTNYGNYYTLQGQTNFPGKGGISTNWYPVSGAVNNFVTIPINPNASSAFYRLIAP
jgi:hypothetical protein